MCVILFYSISVISKTLLNKNPKRCISIRPLKLEREWILLRKTEGKRRGTLLLVQFQFNCRPLTVRRTYHSQCRKTVYMRGFILQSRPSIREREMEEVNGM